MSFKPFPVLQNNIRALWMVVDYQYPYVAHDKHEHIEDALREQTAAARAAGWQIVHVLAGENDCATRMLTTPEAMAADTEFGVLRHDNFLPIVDGDIVAIKGYMSLFDKRGGRAARDFFEADTPHVIAIGGVFGEQCVWETALEAAQILPQMQVLYMNDLVSPQPFPRQVRDGIAQDNFYFTTSDIVLELAEPAPALRPLWRAALGVLQI